jgi:hypothetical protein
MFKFLKKLFSVSKSEENVDYLKTKETTTITSSNVDTFVPNERQNVVEKPVIETVVEEPVIETVVEEPVKVEEVKVEEVKEVKAEEVVVTNKPKKKKTNTNINDSVKQVQPPINKKKRK